MTAIQFDNSYAALPDHFYTKLQPTPSPAPKAIAVNDNLAKQVGIDAQFLKSPVGLEMLSGNDIPKDADPLAMVYAGHQFGGWSPRLGDGRALLLGEIVSPDGRRYDIHLKGSGHTPYSRNGDGKAAIGPVIREYIMSEAMAALNIPTTRALAALTTGEEIIRDGYERGAIFVRLAQSHIRVGTFQYFYAQNDHHALKTLAEYVINRHFPRAKGQENPIKAMFETICKRQAKLIALWMNYGFIHGVMNTDNMQIAGETIDYGPCAFMDKFHANKVFSSIDQHGRYAWSQQPQIGQWNLTRLGEALMPIWNESDEQTTKDIQNGLKIYADTFNQLSRQGFLAKFGLTEAPSTDGGIIEASFKIMQEQQIDFTLFFSNLRRLNQKECNSKFIELFHDSHSANDWMSLWQEAKALSNVTPEKSQKLMSNTNPIYIPRNHRVEQAIAAAKQDDFEPMHNLNHILSKPFTEQDGAQDYEQAPNTDEIVSQTFCGT